MQMKNLCYKKIIIYAFFALVFALSLTVFLRYRANTESAYAQPSAEKASLTYEISDKAALRKLADEVNSGLNDGYYGTTFTLTKSIDLSGAEWTPIGNSVYPFKGVFIGNGNTVNGLSVTVGGGEYVGLFGFLSVNARVENLKVCGGVKGKNYVGGIAGYSSGQITDCLSSVDIEAENDALHVGGVVGYNDGEISRCGNSGTVKSNFATFIGGVSGSNYGQVINCFNTASVSSTGSVIGGIVGMNSDDAVISVCLNSGDVSAKAVSGGICGNNCGSIKNAFNSGTVNSDNGTAAGIVGSNERTGTTAYIFNVGEIYGREDVAAICGYNLGIVTGGIYDNNMFGGKAVNGIAAERSDGLPTYLLMHGDVLTAKNKAYALSEENDGAWVKRNTSTSHCHYPELSFFYNNQSAVSEDAAKVSRVNLTCDDVTLNVDSVVYDGTERKADVYYGDIELEVGQDYTVIYSDNRNAGTAKMQITFINSFCGEAEKTFCIEKSELAVNWQQLRFTYNAQEQAPTVTIESGNIGEEEITFDYLHKQSVNAGSYSIKAVLKDTQTNKNYFLPSTTAEYKIDAAEITVIWSDENFTYNGTVQAPTASVNSGRVGEEEITFRYEHGSNINAGEHSISAYLDDTDVNKNYAFAGDTHIYVIGKQPLTVEWKEQNLYYNGSAQYPVATLTEGRIGEEDITFTYSEFNGNIAANETEGYFVLLSLEDTEINSNYLFEPQRHNYKILRNPIEIEWLDMPLVYNGAAQYPGFYVTSGRIGEDEINFDISDYSQNIGASSGEKYSVEVRLAENAVNSNYSFAAEVKSYDISKAEFSPQDFVEFHSQTFAYDGSKKNIFVNGDLPIGVSVTYENNGQIEIGKYTVAAKFSVNSDNYKPLSESTLTATMSIAQTVFEDASSDIVVRCMGDAVYGLELDLNEISKKSIEQSGKKTLAAYSLSLTQDEVEIQITLSEKVAKRKGLKVLYKNSDNQIVTASHVLKDGKLIFKAENISEFAIVADRDFLPLWICLGILPVMGAATFAIVFICKRRRAHKAVAEADGTRQSVSAVAEESINETADISDDIEKEEIKPVNNVSFTLDGIFCKSYEHFLQSLNFKNQEKQKLICRGDQDAAKLFEYIPHNSVYWCGKRYNKNSRRYSDLILRARQATYEKE